MVNELKSQLLEAVELLNEENEVPAWGPLKDRVMVLPLSDQYMEKRTAAGLYVKGEDRPFQSLVIAVGAGVKEELKAGDVVLTGKYIGEPLELARQKYRLVREADILAVLNEDE